MANPKAAKPAPKPVGKRVVHFRRQNVHTFGRVKDNWRKPRGVDSKLRKRWKSAGPVVKVGYRSDKKYRSMHPSGRWEALVHNDAELSALKEGTAARIAGGVGEHKRAGMRKIAAEKRIHLLN